MELERKNWTKKFLVRLPKDAKPQNEDVDETRLIQGAFEGIYGIELDEQDIIRADHHYLKEESHKESEHLLEYSINFNERGPIPNQSAQASYAVVLLYFSMFSTTA